MGLTIVALTPDEDFLQFLDPELCTLEETHEKGGLRTLNFTYMFQDLHEDKRLFQIGNKLWVSGDTNLTDCLYVINTPVETDVYQENSFHCEMEEVLVELNYAPLFTQNELTASNGFHITTTNGQQSVKVDWNALHYWFSDYYNIGVVQDCLNNEYNKITFNGTQTLMGLLRYIEEETGNIFVTRYEKDCLNNTIHRYLDFLNPLDVSKNWKLNIEYDFVTEDTTGDGIYDEDGNPTTDEYDDVYEEDDIVDFSTDHTPIRNIDPSYAEFRITNEDGLILNSDGQIYTEEEDTPLVWDSDDIGFDSEDVNVAITLSMNHGTLGIYTNTKSFVVPSSTTNGVQPKSFIATYADPTEVADTTIPDDSYFEIYDTQLGVTVFRTCLNREIGHVHEEILDFGFNIENVTFETDETETYNAISPVLSLDNDSDTLTRTDMADIITAWKNLSVSKGETIPMIIEKVTVQASSLSAAQTSLGTYSRTNYWVRPKKPNDNIDTQTASNSTWEFWRGTAYWKAPFTKHAGDLHIRNDSIPDMEYNTIYGRPDIRDDYLVNGPKMGTVETSSETSLQIYNDVALKLKDKMTREFNIEVDVANLRKGQFNQYQLHDKVYVKLPDYTELVTARVVKTTKEAHDVAKNTIELSNYSVNNVKTEPLETVIHASNASFKYPKEKSYSVRLENLGYDSDDPYSIRYLANKLVTFTLYKLENDNPVLTKTFYNKRTDANGYAKINMKYDPGDYELHITFGGDEEYEGSSITVQVNVSGVKEAPVKGVDNRKKTPEDLKQKTTKKTAKAKKTVKNVKRYYSKYGVSPDGKYLMAVGRPSAGGELAKYGYKYYKVVFVRKCPFCGSKELYWNIFWTGNEYGSWGVNPAVNRKKSGSAEGEITCKKCDADFSIFGKDKATTPRKTLKVYKKAVKVKKSEAYTLKKGKMYYDTIKQTVKAKKVESTKTRQIPSGINENVKKLALSIVGDSTGLAAAKKIAKWCGHKGNLKYDYYSNFLYGPKTVKNRKAANCCDSARFMLTLMAAAGCAETLKLEYTHVVTPGTNTGHVFTKITTKSTGKWRYVDPVLKFEKGSNPWGHWYKGCGTTFVQGSVWPDLPF